MTIEIVILAMIACFLGLRLYSVLGRRSEHEEEPVPGRFEGKSDGKGPAQLAPRPVDRELDREAESDSSGHQLAADTPVLQPETERGLRDIASADKRFDINGFVDGACGAYRQVLEAFWQGDKDALKPLCGEDVFAGFVAAIDARNTAGEVLENRLVRIEQATITQASYAAPTARITLRFTADIAAITRDKQGQVIAGSLDDAVEIRDLWSFSRVITSTNPDWLLDETDEG